MEKQIEAILKKHSFTQNSFLDETGHNHWTPLIKELNTALSTLLQQVGNELIGQDDQYTGEKNSNENQYKEIRNEHRAELRSKLDSVISQIKNK